MTEKQIAALDWAAKLMGYKFILSKDIESIYEIRVFNAVEGEFLALLNNNPVWMEISNPLTDANLLAEVRAKFLEKFPHLEMEILHFIKIGKPITIAKIGTFQGYQSKGESENPLEAELMAMFKASNDALRAERAEITAIQHRTCGGG